MAMKATSVRLSDRLLGWVAEEARKEGISVSQFLRESALLRLGYVNGLREEGQADTLVQAINERAVALALDALHQRLGFSLWMVTRIDGDDWRIEHARDEGYGLGPGDTFRWRDSYCYHMASGKGPRMAPDARSVACYARAPIGREFPISAYVGAPLFRADGSLFGTLCAIDPEPQPDRVAEEQPVLESYADLVAKLVVDDARARRN
jgi:GAF domain-containing protein